MTSADFLEFVLLTAVTLSVTALAWWARKHPNQAKEHPERVRMPKVIAFLGWVFTGVGLLLCVASWTSSGGALGARLTCVGFVLVGLAFLAGYRNFYVAPRQYEVAFRTVFGREHVVPYRDIAKYHVTVGRGQRILTIRSVHGPRLSVNIRTFDVSPLLRAIDYHQVTGRWPAQVDIPAGEAWPGPAAQPRPTL